VLSVGNLTFGGTGKTPFVIHACEQLIARGCTPAILSRGYRAHDELGNDEARVIAAHLPEVRHAQNPNRYEAGLPLADAVDCFVLDDGFQHHPLARDADLVLVDATDPFGGGFCPPAGRLREPPDALSRATLVVLTRADQVEREDLGETMRRVRARTEAPIATAAFEPSCDEPLEGREVTLACGIGNPRAFVATAVSMGAVVAETVFYRDHHAYTAADAERLAERGRPVLVTEKDAVKLQALWRFEVPLLVVRIAVRMLEAGDELDGLLDRFARLCGSGR
jgi:tetraacyldisaccharide 4'-kinase